MDPLLILLGAKLLFGNKGASSSSSSPIGPSPAPSPVGPAPVPVPFPNQIPDNVQPVAPHMLKAIEVWMIDPRSTLQLPAVVGDDVVVDTLQSTFPRGWRPVPQVTANEITRAKALLGVWVKGRVLFDGPKTTADRRAFVMTQHPAHGATPSPTPAPVHPPGFDPISHGPQNQTTPAPAPAPVPPAPEPPPAPDKPNLGTHKVTTVRRGEGLANIAIRLLGPDGNHAWPELRADNIPKDADGRTRRKAPDDKGGISPMLQPGQRLFVPANWDVDPTLL